MKSKLKKWERNCPSCGTVIEYKDNSNRNNADIRNTECRRCCTAGSKNGFYGKVHTKETLDFFSESQKGDKSAWYGKHHTDITKQKMSEFRRNYKYSEEGCKNLSIAKQGKSHPMYGKTHSTETIEKMKLVKLGKNNPFYGKHHSDKTKNIISAKSKGKIVDAATCKKQRISTIQYIEKCIGNNGQLQPRYNISSIPILEQKAKELNIFDLQHAENGGEYFIKELGYWVDGYSKDRNIVIEYYEKFHNKKIKRDLRRQNEIMKFLNCQFIIIYEV